MSTDQFKNSDQPVVADSAESKNKLSDEAAVSLSSEDGARAGNDKGSVDEKPLGLPEVTFTDQPLEQAKLDEQLSAAVKSGSVEDIQKVMAGIDSPEKFSQLQESVEALNKNAPEGVKYQVAEQHPMIYKTGEFGTPVLTVSSSEPKPSFGPHQSESWTVKIGAEIEKGYHHTPGVFQGGWPTDPQHALDKIQKKS